MKGREKNSIVMFISVFSYKKNRSWINLSRIIYKRKKLLRVYENSHITHKVRSFSINFLYDCVIFIEHLLIRNSYTNLISNRTTYNLYKKHIVDSLTLLSIFGSLWPNSRKRCCLDVGTGGGFPGFVLTLLFPHFFFCLLDSIKRKIQFHYKISIVLKLRNCSLLCTRAELMGSIKKHTMSYDFVLIRAVSAFPKLIGFCIPLLKSSGKLFILKKIKNIHNEICNCSFFLSSYRSKIKSLITTSLVKEGKVVLTVNRCKILDI
nr:glucose-inhibited division protein B [Cryptomonas sp.]